MERPSKVKKLKLNLHEQKIKEMKEEEVEMKEEEVEEEVVDALIVENKATSQESAHNVKL